MAKQKSKEVALVVAEERIIVDELVDQGEYSHQKTTDIRISHTNRKRFNEQALQDLAANIKEVGILQPILLRPVTPTDSNPEHFEIVAGERRWRAACIAGLDVVPTIVRNLSDKQAAEIQILENVQREDPHPLEEAEGYEQLMMNHGYNADQLADKIKKSRSYIYGRFKLCALALDVREQFLNEAIPASTALLLARIPVPKLQSRALAEIINPSGMFPSEPMSYRRAQQHIQQRYTLDLTTANFEMDDAKLLVVAGACTKCPKRSGNQPILFADIKSADVCTDPDCFSEKRAAQYAKVIVIANKTGIPVLEGEEADKIVRSMYGTEADLVDAETELWNFERNAPTTQNEGEIEELIGKENMPKPAKYLKNEDGSVKPIYHRSDIQTALEKAGACETIEQHAARMASIGGASATARDDDDDVGDDGLEKVDVHAVAAQRLSARRVALYKELRARASNGFCLSSLREFTKDALGEFNMPRILADIYPFNIKDDAEVSNHIDQAPLPEVQLLLVDLFLGNYLQVDRWDIQHGHTDDDGFKTIQRMAEHEGIDTEQVYRAHELHVTPIGDIAPADFSDLIRLAPERLADLTAVVMDAQPHNISALQEAATAQGYTWSQWKTPEPGSAWVKGNGSIVETSTAPNEDQSPATEEPPVEPTVDGDYVAPSEFEKPAVEPAKPAAKGKSTKTKPPVVTVLTPAAAWPFPKSK